MEKMSNVRFLHWYITYIGTLVISPPENAVSLLKWPPKTVLGTFPPFVYMYHVTWTGVMCHVTHGHLIGQNYGLEYNL